MSAELKPAASTAVATVKPSLVSGGAVRAIVPSDIEAVYRLATIVIKAGMTPKAIDTAEKATVIIMHGMEVGFTPMASLQSIGLINGMPGIYGDGLIGLVQASGLLEDIIETIERDKDGSPLYAVCRVKRAGRSSWTEQSFSRAEAQKAGLWSKGGPWTQYPRRMLQMRARAWALRDAFPDVLKGLRSAEELQDMVDVTAQGSHTVTPPEPRRSDFVTEADQTEERRAAEDAATETQAEGAKDEATTTESTEPYTPEGGWQKFAKFSEFVEYSTDFLAHATPLQATAWNANYAAVLQDKMMRGTAPQKEAVNALLKTYGEMTRTPASTDDAFPGDLPSKSAA